MANEAIKIANMERTNKFLLKNMMENGITATTKELISRNTGLALATVVRYYPTKDSMVMAAIEEIGRKYAMKDVKFTGTAFEQLTQFYDMVIEQFIRLPHLWALKTDLTVYANHCKDDTALKALIDTMGYRKIMQEIFELGEKDKSISCKILPFNASVYYGNILFDYMSGLVLRHDLKNKEELNNSRFILNYLKDGLLSDVAVK